MKQTLKIGLLLLVVGFTSSCDYSTIKKENERLKEVVYQLEQAELKRKREEDHRLYLESIKKYAVVVTTYNDLISVSRSPVTGEYTPKYKIDKYVSRIIEVSSNITKDDEYKLIDKNTLFFSQTTFGYKSHVLDRKLHLFDTYSEASAFARKEENSVN